MSEIEAQPLQSATEHSRRPGTGYEGWTADRLLQRIFAHSHTIDGDFQLKAELKYRLRHEEAGNADR
jgi:hypothetical protein